MTCSKRMLNCSTRLKKSSSCCCCHHHQNHSFKPSSILIGLIWSKFCFNCVVLFKDFKCVCVCVFPKVKFDEKLRVYYSFTQCSHRSVWSLILTLLAACRCKGDSRSCCAGGSCCCCWTFFISDWATKHSS